MNNETQPLETLSPFAGDGAETLPLQQEDFPDDIGDDGEALPQLKVTKKSVIPNWISSNSKQHVVLVRDRSTSMQGHKLKELNEACQDLLQILADPENKDGFIVSVIDFSDEAEKRIVHESASKMHMPQAICSGGTNFETALKATLDVVNDFIQKPNDEGWHYLRPQVFFLSDGHSNASQSTIKALKEMADITAIAYGAGADESMLSQIATNGYVQIIGTNGSELRQFLADVGKTLSQGLSDTR